ncbi:hypothetical protein QKW60_05740 [Defluviimonas aestuarii]|uniref:hypothetical protein n=1 Tax=Albidovulum aestuarii TaxID=1130726 RepID=UPI00249C2827|nr:hypothetical protein [Defluviimonas aestuarii]MDI3335899.1 hypothetical protein [Defluviimonas aestuarii]
MSLYFEAPSYAGGRHLLKSGSVNVGAVFPPARGAQWEWRLFLTELGPAASGHAPSEQAAKNALIGRFRDFLRAADLETTP